MSTKHAILAAISSKPQTGYQLGKKIEGSIGFFWSATLQQIYRELGELQAAGWLTHKDVEQAARPDKKVYRITRAGTDELKKWISLDADLPPAKDALLIKIFAGHLVPTETLIKVLERHYEKRTLRLKRYQEIEKYFKSVEDLSDEASFQYLTVRRGITFERAWLAWGNETKDFLKSRGCKDPKQRKPAP